jgi:hypothetical protein
VHFSTREEFKNTIKHFGKQTRFKSILQMKENKRQNLFSSIFSLFIAFLAVSPHDELENTIQIFSEIRPEHLQKISKESRQVGTSHLIDPWLMGLSFCVSVADWVLLKRSATHTYTPPWQPRPAPPLSPPSPPLR